MINAIKLRKGISILILLVSTPILANDLISKDVYSFKSDSGTPVFTDKKPIKNKTYTKRTIEVANSTTNDDNHSIERTTSNSPTNETHIIQTHKVVIENRTSESKRAKKRKTSQKRCQYYKKKFTYYSEKMNAGYRSSEYKNLEKNRVKYRNLLFNRCSTKTFEDS